MKIIKTTIFTAIILTLVFIINIPTLAFSDENLNNNRAGLISVSYRGDTENYPENSLEAVLSAKEIGADMVSVGVAKTKDGVLILAENENLGNFCNFGSGNIGEVNFEEIENAFLYDNAGNLTEYKIAELLKVLQEAEGVTLILDIAPELKDEVYDLVVSLGAIERVALRFEENSKSITEWINSKENKIQVIGKYNGNIVWNAVSHIENLSENCSIVHYESKNYFNVMYGSFVAKRFSSDNKARALAPTYDRNLCGQREDNASGWNELIEKGFSVIETNNIASLVEYVNEAERLNISLKKLTDKAKETDLTVYSDVSADNFKKALQKAEEVLQSGISSVGELESANSQLLHSMNRLNLSDGKESQKGAFNITAGKIVAAISVGAAILSAQIYVHKMQQEKRRKQR